MPLPADGHPAQPKTHRMARALLLKVHRRRVIQRAARGERAYVCERASPFFFLDEAVAAGVCQKLKDKHNEVITVTED